MRHPSLYSKVNSLYRYSKELIMNKKVIVLAIAAIIGVSVVGCSPKPFVLKTVMGTVDPYFHGAE